MAHQPDKKGAYDWYSPMGKGGYVPEYVNFRDETILAPKASEIKDLARREVTKSSTDMYIIVPAVDLQTGGKLPVKDLHTVDAYLRDCYDLGRHKALLALSFPTPRLWTM